MDLPATDFTEIGLATIFLLGAGFLLGTDLEAGAVPFFVEFLAGTLLTAAPCAPLAGLVGLAGLAGLAADAEEEGCFPREVAPPEPELAGDFVFDFVGFLAGGTGGSPG